MASQSEVKLTIGEQRVTTADVTKGQSVDLLHRDPENLHDNLKVGHCSWLHLIPVTLQLHSYL